MHFNDWKFLGLTTSILSTTVMLTSLRDSFGKSQRLEGISGFRLEFILCLRDRIEEIISN